jgi:hypothetical protein
MQDITKFSTLVSDIARRLTQQIASINNYTYHLQKTLPPQIDPNQLITVCQIRSGLEYLMNDLSMLKVKHPPAPVGQHQYTSTQTLDDYLTSQIHHDNIDLFDYQFRKLCRNTTVEISLTPPCASPAHWWWHQATRPQSILYIAPSTPAPTHQLPDASQHYYQYHTPTEQQITTYNPHHKQDTYQNQTNTTNQQQHYTTQQQQIPALNYHTTPKIEWPEYNETTYTTTYTNYTRPQNPDYTEFF